MGCGENHHINAKFKWQLVKTITLYGDKYEL